MSGALGFRKRSLRPTALRLSDSEVLLGQPICPADVSDVVGCLRPDTPVALLMSRAQVRWIVCSTFS